MNLDLATKMNRLIKKIRRTLGIIYRNMKFTFIEEVKREFFPPKLPNNIANKIYIHLGCGPINSQEFINVDTMPYSHVHYINVVENLHMFSDEYADLIYACHVLEHLSHNSLLDVLKEWRRVLKINGVLRISVPDVDKIIDVYFSENKDIRTIIGPLMGGQDFQFNYHKSVFNEKYLNDLLFLTGFHDIRDWKPNSVEFHSFVDWASRPIKVGAKAKEYLISLNIEAVK
ncbi:MAG TPA: methyltransferase domain-containing protein [Candidatus Limnocylindrales bacterium]|nr:methyltransferase domain-containing protein [Candidatus Limnocylindrales bacterium]